MVSKDQIKAMADKKDYVTTDQVKAWHLYSHEEKIEKFQQRCQYCNKPYVNYSALWIHENEKCPKRPVK